MLEKSALVECHPRCKAWLLRLSLLEDCGAADLWPDLGYSSSVTTNLGYSSLNVGI